MKDYEYEVKTHLAHDTIYIDQDNALDDLLGPTEEWTSNSVTTVVMSEKQSINISSIFHGPNIEK